MKRAWLRVRSVWRALRRPAQLDAAMQEEMRFHVDMEAERLVREHGLDALEASRRAHAAFGGLQKYRQEGRYVWGLQWIDRVSLDTRLGVRMLLKHRGLTLVGSFAMTAAIGLGATFFELLSQTRNPALPFPDGDRVVAVQYGTATPGSPERRVLRDFVAWREEVASLDELGAFRTVQLNLVSGRGLAEPVHVAEITAAGFTIPRTPPLLGRYLLPSDERPGAAPVVVIGYDAWHGRFGGSPDVVGRTITLGGTPTTVVGVMPEGFKFPVDHQFWSPLRLDASTQEGLEGLELSVFGRLARGVSMEAAQAELNIIGQHTAAARPEHDGQLRLRVFPYTHESLGITDPARAWALRLAQILVGALTFVVAVNLAILVYARTVTRLGEIAVRTALGASRSRILAQLFVEALALSTIGAAIGLILADVALERLQWMIVTNGSSPFWIHLDLSLGTIVYALGLAVLAAAVMGVLPGIKATGIHPTVNLRELNGRTGARLGPVWTTLVVTQVAVAVAVLPMAVYMAGNVVRMELSGAGFDADAFVIATMAMSDEVAAVDADRVATRQLDLMARLRAEPQVSAVTFSSSVPGIAPSRSLQFEGGRTMAAAETHEVNTVDVALDMFDVFEAEMLAGHTFNAADFGAANAVVVNRSFVRDLLHDRDALGIRFHYVGRRRMGAEAMPKSYQIVGVVRDFPTFPPSPLSDLVPTVYHPAAPGDVHPLVVSVRFGGSVPAGFVGRFRAIGAEVDPALQLRRVMPLADLYRVLRSLWRYVAWGMGMATMSVLLLSSAGIYAMMSFTVTQRTHEIAIRSALGAAPHRLVLNVFARAALQIGLGLVAGSLLSSAILIGLDVNIARLTALVLTVAAVMLTVGLLATLGPARRGLRVQPSDALKTN
jgi:putative ABC transport system permease protein